MNVTIGQYGPASNLILLMTHEFQGGLCQNLAERAAEKQHIRNNSKVLIAAASARLHHISNHSRDTEPTEFLIARC